MSNSRVITLLFSGLLLGSIAHGSFLSTLNDDDPSFVYSPSEAWSEYIHSEDLAGESTVTTTVGATVSFSFIGSSFRYVGERWVDQSTSAVTIDGQLYTVDEFANSTDIEFNVILLDISPLPFQRHNVTIAKTGDAGKYTTLDYIQFTVDSAAPPKSTSKVTSPSLPVPANTSPGSLITIPDDHPGMAYSSGWTHCPHPEDQGGASSCSTASGVSVNFSFAGTSLAWIGEMWADQGVSIVTLDGVSYSVSQYAPNSQNILFNQSIFFLDNLADTIHDVVIQKNSPAGWYITIDQIQFTAGNFKAQGNKSSSKVSIGAVVGGVVGGLVVLAAAAVLSLRFCCGRRMRRNLSRPITVTQIYQDPNVQIYHAPQVPVYQDPYNPVYQTPQTQVYRDQPSMFMPNPSVSMSYDSSSPFNTTTAVPMRPEL
ncbi:hypothetical protein BDN72DRAFT_901327 [Pluteus cervinus]|uniref:Uncharacterized protein n=1 Tax=Pluteus cervinus TaxID=181527 RepID=A0ACD3AIM1_9AGAR|nr:hypothetical protein BDN72DRAFT_901327 [Pluteus cervinus]